MNRVRSKPRREGRRGMARLGIALALLVVAALSVRPGPVARAAVVHGRTHI
jgi:hypothetical protein